VQRIAAVIQLRPEKAAEYRQLHAAVWPEVLEALWRVGIKNYSIFERDGLLFSYLEFHGSDYAAATAELAADETTRRWWALTDPCQLPLTTAAAGEWWAPAVERFHLD
jgi:L-rhamnose mutarotase